DRPAHHDSVDGPPGPDGRVGGRLPGGRGVRDIRARVLPLGRQLHDARLRRHRHVSALAPAWTATGGRRHARLWLVVGTHRDRRDSTLSLPTSYRRELSAGVFATLRKKLAASTPDHERTR